MGITDNLSDLEVLTLTIIGEARGEPIEGQVGVASVVRNRFTSNTAKYHSLSDVCLEPKQFSCWNENDPNRAILLEMANSYLAGNGTPTQYRQCLCVARGIISGEIKDNTRNALNYLTAELFNSPNKPSWSVNVYPAVNLGHQVFFTASHDTSTLKA